MCNTSKKAVFVAGCLGMFMTFACNSPEPSPNADPRTNETASIQVSGTPKVDDHFELAAKNLTESYNTKNCENFVELFPKSISELDSLYGFDEVMGERVLISQTETHLEYFFDCPEVSDLAKLNKVIHTGVDGRWDADAISVFQRRSQTLVRNHMNEAKRILDELPDEKAASFWYFLFDGPHSDNHQGTVEMFVDLLGTESKQSRLLTKRYQKVQTDWKDH